MQVLTLQQIVLSKNRRSKLKECTRVLTLQQIVLSKNPKRHRGGQPGSFDFTTNCSF